MRKLILAAAIFGIAGMTACAGGTRLRDGIVYGNNYFDRELEDPETKIQKIWPIYSYDDDLSSPNGQKVLDTYGYQAIFKNKHSKMYLYVNNDGEALLKCLESLKNPNNAFCSVLQKNSSGSQWVDIKEENGNKIYTSESFIRKGDNDVAGYQFVFRDKRGQVFRAIFWGKTGR